jgi:hypothetical protein
MLAYLSMPLIDYLLDSRKHNILVLNLLMEGASNREYYKHRRFKLTKSLICSIDTENKRPSI